MPHLSHHRHLKKHKGHSVLYKLVLAMAIIEPIMSVPQVYEIWIKHRTGGVSLATWAFFTVAAVIWLFYGLQIKNTPLIISSTLWIIMEGSIVLGLIIY